MKIFKELEEQGFFEWYAKQYGDSSNHSERNYQDIYDSLPSDNLTVIGLRAAACRWLREEHGCICFSYQPNETGYWAHSLENKAKYDSYDESEKECLITAILAVRFVNANPFNSKKRDI